MGGNAPLLAPPCEGRGCPPWKKNPAHDTRQAMLIQNIYSFIKKNQHRLSPLRKTTFTGRGAQPPIRAPPGKILLAYDTHHSVLIPNIYSFI